jgi:DNA-binding CsgD family transcriptional regulator
MSAVGCAHVETAQIVALHDPLAREAGSALSAAALAVHRRCRELTPSDYLQLGFETVSNRIPFDAAFWLRGHKGEPARCGAHTAGCNASLAAEYAALSGATGFPCCEKDHKNLTVGIDFSDGAGPAELASLALRWGLPHALAAHVEEPVTALTFDIVLWRTGAHGPFVDLERRLLHALAPHLDETYGINRLVQFARAAGRREPQLHACAIADGRGYLRVAPDRFVALLLREFPGWCGGPQMPSPLARRLPTGSQSGESRFVGAHVSVRATRVGDTYLLRGREKHPLDSLTARELEIARLSAQGLGAREIAGVLGISLVTARNHLNRILIKSGAPRRPVIAAQLAELG